MDVTSACYIWNPFLIEQCDRLPAVQGRASMVHNLIEAYNLTNHVRVVQASPASYTDLKKFHSELYLDHLKTLKEIDDDYTCNTIDKQFGLGYDCQPVSNMFDLVSALAGGSLAAAKCLVHDIADVAINWCGGWHHAHRFGAAGFCYVNDIVLAIEEMRKKYAKILYIDLDVHHGNGVQDAYSTSNTVFTLSIHKREASFYPGSGDLDDIGSLAGKGYTCNMPLHGYYTDTTLEYVFEKIFNSICSCFEPDAIVVQCGADALAHDPYGGANLTTKGYCSCVRMVLNKAKPCLLLGGGGYKHENAARLWTTLTALVTGEKLNEFIPEHDEWIKYGPSYHINVEPTLVKDYNKTGYLDDCIFKIRVNLMKYLGYKGIVVQPRAKKRKLETCTAVNTKEEHALSKSFTKNMNLNN